MSKEQNTLNECIEALYRINGTVLIATNSVDDEFLGIVKQGSFNLEAYKEDFEMIMSYLRYLKEKCIL